MLTEKDKNYISSFTLLDMMELCYVRNDMEFQKCRLRERGETSPHSVSLILHIIMAALYNTTTTSECSAWADGVAVFNLTFPFASKGETTKT